MMKFPKNKNGKGLLSYTQIKLWNEAKGFNTGKLGKEEYILQYFLGQKFDDKGGFGQFGAEVEGYITERKFSESFNQEEKSVLEKIEPLGTFQKELNIEFDEFTILGFMDDCTSDFKHIRDYKTASQKSKDKYYLDDYNQLDFYALGIQKEFGFIPKKLEVCAIERLGNGFRGGRSVMTVGQEIWYIEKKTSKQKLKELEKSILITANEISNLYKTFLKLNR